MVNVPDDIDTKRLKELHVASSSFAMKPEVTGVKYMYFDKEFEEWVLISDDFVPTTKGRLSSDSYGYSKKY